MTRPSTTTYSRWIATNADGGKQLNELLVIEIEDQFGPMIISRLHFIEGELFDSYGVKYPSTEYVAKRFLQAYKKSIK